MSIGTVAVWYGIVAFVSAFLWRFLSATGSGYSSRFVFALYPSLWRATLFAAFGALCSWSDFSTSWLVVLSVGVCFALAPYAEELEGFTHGASRIAIPPALLMLFYSLGSLFYLERGQMSGALQVERWEIIVSVGLVLMTIAYLAVTAFRARGIHRLTASIRS